MSVEEQREHYENNSEIGSDPWGLISRDNRNHRKKAQLVMAETAADVGSSVLEVGCGHGLHAQIYDERYEYTGVDLSSSLVEETRERVDGTVVCCDALDLPFGAGFADAVVGGAILHHIPEPRAALEEWIRVARDSVTLIEPNYLFPKDMITAHVQEAEQHKTMMAPWRVREIVADVPGNGSVTPCIYTLPWPARAGAVYDAIDDVAGSVPGVRWLSQMLLIHIDVTG